MQLEVRDKRLLKNKWYAGVKETSNLLAMANGVGWYNHVLRRGDDSVLKVFLDFEVSGKRK